MKLIPNKQYHLKHTGQFCNSSKGDFQEGEYTFVGTINLVTLPRDDERNIFYSSLGVYVMFGASTVDYVIDPKEEKLKSFLKENEIGEELLIKVWESFSDGNKN